MLHFPETDGMPELPALSVPDYRKLNEDFRAALSDPQNQVLRYAANGHPVLGAYVGSTSNEMVTWGILAVGEYLMNRDAAWISPTFTDFYSDTYKVWMNSPGIARTEHWYMFYVNTLAGAVAETVYKGDAAIRAKMEEAAATLRSLAHKLGYDFNQQGYFFDEDHSFTNKDIYRQPDSIGGFAYNMLYAFCHNGNTEYLDEARRGISLYQAFDSNPWYEIPNGSAALMASSWLNAHGTHTDVARAAAWVFDHEKGPMQTGVWGGEQIDGLMMGWRGDTRELAMSTAYSMETLMPLQFVLPSVRYAPDLADAVGRYVLCVLANFQLFYARGTRKLYETRPDLTPSIPYERLDACRDGHSPAACGDFCGHRSVYGAGYLYWLEALARPTQDRRIFALDLSLTDWLCTDKYPVFLLRNPYGEARTVSFTPAPIWEKLRPELFKNHVPDASLYTLDDSRLTNGTVTIPAHGTRIVALVPREAKLSADGAFITANGSELIYNQEV